MTGPALSKRCSARWPEMVDNGLMTAGGSAPLLPARARRAARRFAEIVCPPDMAAHHRTDRVLGELELMLAALAPEARKALTVTLVVLDQAARLSPGHGGGVSPSSTTRPPRRTSGRCSPAAVSPPRSSGGSRAWS